MNKKQLKPNSLAAQFRRDYFIISIVLVLSFFTLLIGGATITRNYLAGLIKHSTQDLNRDAQKNLEALGEKIIQAKARDVARQIEIYFRMNPEMSIRQMRQDPFFQSIALQKVGNTGYTAMYDAPSCIFRVHPNPKTLDKDMSYLKKELPSWWKIVGATLGGDEVSGYYDWIDSDGTTRKKYMTVTPVGTPLKGQTMMVAATTYIDEFSTPVKDMELKAEKIIHQYQRYVSRQGIIFGIVSFVVALIAFYGVYWLGTRASSRYILPIMQLADITRDLGEGKWEISSNDHLLQRKDEIGTLAQALNSMSNQLKELFRNLKKRVIELKQVQNALKESEEHYRNLFEGVPVGLYQSSPDGKVFDANTTMIKMLGFPDRKSFLKGTTKDLYVNPGDRDIWKAHMEQSDGSIPFETQMQKYDGTQIWVENHSRIVWESEDQILYYEGSLIDTTERRNAEAALRESELRLREAQELAGLGYWEWNIESGDFIWSKKIYEILRVRPTEFNPNLDSVMALSPWPEYKKLYRELPQRACETEERRKFDQKFLCPDGSEGYYHSTFKGKYNNNGNLVSISGTMLDITERKIQEMEINSLRNYLSNIINSMPSILVGVNKEGIITQWNSKASYLTGLSDKDVVGRPIDKAIPQLSIDLKKVHQAIKTRKEITDNKRFRMGKGKPIYEDMTIYPLIANGVEGAVIRIDDVTEKTRLEEMMVQSEKMLSVGGLAAGMAHEINNPLAGITQTAEVMANRLTQLQIPANLRAAEEVGTTMEAIDAFMEIREIPSMLAAIKESSRRMAKIVDNMLSFARKSESQPSSYALDLLLEKILDLAATDYDLKKAYDFKKIKLIKNYEPNLPAVICESAKIQQVLLNILKNGAQAMQSADTQNPCFTFRTYYTEIRNMVCLEVEDNGPGIDNGIRKRIFEPFFTTKSVGEGTGLGLSVSYFIITEVHKGEIDVESQAGAGAKFIIRLPAAGKD